MYYLLIVMVVVIWGVGSFLGKLATSYNNPTFVTVCSNVLYFIFSMPLLLILLKNEESMGKFDLSFAALWPIVGIGVLGLSGEWFYFTALSKGPGVPVIALTALYPLVSMLFLLGLLGERVSRNQSVEVVLIFIGLVIFLWDKKEVGGTEVDYTNASATALSGEPILSTEPNNAN